MKRERKIKKLFMVVCYNRQGYTDHIRFARTLKAARDIRTIWGIKIGLRPEPSSDFGLYPTIWEYSGEGDEKDRKNYKRLAGY